MNQKHVAVVGAGHLGKIHAKLLKTIDGVQPYVVEPNCNARQFVESELQIPTFESINDIGQPLDAAIVVTPTQTHFEIASELIEAGCHLFVEKPICADAASSRALCELAERNGRILQVGHVERFNPAFVAAKPHLNKPMMMECSRLTPYTFRATDVSVVQDLMIHDIDLVLSTIKSKVVKVEATGSKLIGPHWDTVVAWLDFENGAKACLRASRTSHRPNRSMQCLLENGSLNIDFADQSVERVTAVENIRDELSQLDDVGKQAAKDQFFEKWLPVTQIEVNPQNAILEEQREFVACLSDDSFPTVSGRDGLAAVEVAEEILNVLNSQARQGRNRMAA